MWKQQNKFDVTVMCGSLCQVLVQMEPSEAYEVIHYVPAPSLPYSQPGSCYTLIRLPDDDPTAGRNAGMSLSFLGQ